MRLVVNWPTVLLLNIVIYSYFSEISQWTTKSSECLSTPSGEDYTGHLDHTVSGIKCQRWTSEVPHKHAYNDIKYFADYSTNPESVIQDVENYCRNPSVLSSTDAQPWCFTTNENITKEFCDIPRCKSKRVISLCTDFKDSSLICERQLCFK